MQLNSSFKTFIKIHFLKPALSLYVQVFSAVIPVEDDESSNAMQLGHMHTSYVWSLLPNIYGQLWPFECPLCATKHIFWVGQCSPQPLCTGMIRQPQLETRGQEQGEMVPWLLGGGGRRTLGNQEAGTLILPYYFCSIF